MSRLSVALFAVILLACGGDATGPGAGFHGDYVLVAVNGAPVPAKLYDGRCASQMVSAFLRVESDDSLSVHSRMISNPCAGLNPLPEVDYLGYMRHGAQLLIVYPAVTFGRAWVDTATITGDTITVRHQWLDLTIVSALRFERQ